MSTRHAYVGCYSGFTEKGVLGWVGTPNAGVGITHFLLDEATGKLTPTGTVTEQDSPAWLEPSPCGKFLIATHELSHHTGVPVGTGFLSSYAVNADTGALTKVCQTSTGGHGNTCCSFDRTGKFLLVTRYWESGVSVLPWNAADGTIGEVCDAPQHSGQGPHPLRQSIPHPHGIHGDPLTDIVYAMDLGNDNVVQYTLDTGTGKLTHLSDVHMGAESGPRGIVFHPSLRIAYINCELGGTVVACAIDDTTGLAPKQTVKVYPADFVGDDHPDNFGKASFWTAEALLSKDARFLYTICRIHHSICILPVNEDGSLDEGAMTRFALLPGSNSRNFTLSPSGELMLVASQDADAVEVLRIDASSGALERVDTVPVNCAADAAVL